MKAIRKRIAEANDIKYEPEECNAEGDCSGTCPKCEEEVKYIEQQLGVRRMLGKAVVVAGLGVSLTALSCSLFTDKRNLLRGRVPSHRPDTVEQNDTVLGEAPEVQAEIPVGNNEQ